MDTAASKNERVTWVDTLKFIGMFSIYVGHFLSLTGLSYAFIFAYGVQVFFFASGFFAVSRVQKPFGETLLHKARALLLPYLCFSAVAAALISVQNNYGLEQVLPLVRQTFLGMRNQTPAIALWFLPCLFLQSVLYDALYRLLHRPRLIFALSMVIYLLTAVFVDPIGEPKWIFSLDSALYFLPFYALGPVVYPYLARRGKDRSLKRRAGLAAAGLLVTAVTLCIYFAKMLPFYQRFAGIPLFPQLYPFFTACVLTAFLVMAAQALDRFPLLRGMGQKTLYFCGCETIVKLLVPELLGLAGLTLSLNNPLAVYLYGFLLMLVSYYTLVPFLEKLFGGWFR